MTAFSVTRKSPARQMRCLQLTRSAAARWEGPRSSFHPQNTPQPLKPIKARMHVGRLPPSLTPVPLPTPPGFYCQAWKKPLGHTAGMASSTSDSSGRFVAQLILLLSSAPSSFPFFFSFPPTCFGGGGEGLPHSPRPPAPVPPAVVALGPDQRGKEGRRGGFLRYLWDTIACHLLHANGPVLSLSYLYLRIQLPG